jgi:pyridinium-3,5-biscarboxylic acid mononucleotide synthase
VSGPGTARLRELLDGVASGAIGPEQALEDLRDLPFADLGEMRLDHHRELRTGLPEVVLGETKTPEQCARAAAELMRHGDGPVLVTRADESRAEAVRIEVPAARYDPVGRVVVAREAAGDARVDGRAVIAIAGTSDLPVARECATVLEAAGVLVRLLTDVGVAGVHRLLAERDALGDADVIVTVAGMEGALPTLIAGLVPVPVIGVPTSVGYGVAADGRAALSGMLASCSPGLTVVNIDNGFGGAAAAIRVLRLAAGA